METIFWFFVYLTAFIYFGFPAVMYLLAQLFGKEPQKGGIAPFISIIIAAHNEEKVIAEKVENTLKLDYPADKFEIIFALDGCTDATKQILAKYNDPRIKIIDKPEREGKVSTLNKAVPQAKGEILIFSDANSIYDPEAILKLIRNFIDTKVGCVAGRLSYTNANRTSVGQGENLYWKYETFIKMQESRLGKLLITNGSIQAVRSNAYPYPNPAAADDFCIPLLIQSKGFKVLYEPQAVAYEVATQDLKEEFNQKVRIVSQGFKGIKCLGAQLFGLNPLGIFELLFHKFLRWGVAYYLALILLFNLALTGQPVYLYLLILQIIFYLLALTGYLLRDKSRIKIFYIPFYFCLVNFAAVIALYEFLCNRNTATWDKAHTTRVGKQDD
jgi:cellulose synthase/poly-beta-1,6-N-acetylglucosamine synthase-like glycosyltransferase